MARNHWQNVLSALQAGAFSWGMPHPCFESQPKYLSQNGTGVEHRHAVAAILFQSTIWVHAKTCVDAFNDGKLARRNGVNSHDLLLRRRQMACVIKKTIRKCAVGGLCRVHVALKNIAVWHVLRDLLWLAATNQRASKNLSEAKSETALPFRD